MDAISSRTIDEVVRRIIEAVRPERIILFGSRAAGAADSGSDIDLAVVVSGDIHRRKTAQKIYMGLIGMACSVDVIVLKPEDLEKYANSTCVIVPEILKAGKELYVA